MATTTATSRSTEQNQTPHIQQQSHANPQWVGDIKAKLLVAKQDNESRGSWAKTSIYRIPKCLRQGGDNKAYIPHTVALGPYHHGDERLRSMERHKWRALESVLQRTKQDIELYLNAVRKLEEDARSCYEGPIDLTSNEFVEMMVLDSCFVLELFRVAAAKDFPGLCYSSYDPVFAMRAPAMRSVQRDMFLLENQIPLFVLEKLNEIQYGDRKLKGGVPRLVMKFFKKNQNMPWDSSHGNAVNNYEPHCLEVYRRSLLAVQTETTAITLQTEQGSQIHGPSDDKKNKQLIHCVTDLKAAGIKFESKTTDRYRDISYDEKKGVLAIPRLPIHYGTRSLFLNLIAFEQCHFSCSNEITAYVFFMDKLIDSPADVSCLRECGIIENWLGSDEAVADLFNKLCHEVVFDYSDSWLLNLSKEVNGFCKNKWNGYWAKLSQTYLGDPWLVLKVIAATFLLLLATAQTYYTMKAYYKQHFMPG